MPIFDFWIEDFFVVMLVFSSFILIVVNFEETVLNILQKKDILNLSKYPYKYYSLMINLERLLIFQRISSIKALAISISFLPFL